MTAGDLEGVTVMGRPIKPVALGLTILMLSLLVINLTGVGELTGTLLARVIAVMAGTAAVTLVAGWVWRSQRMAQAGLLLAAIVYITRSAFIALDSGIGSIGVWLGGGAGVIAAGAYLLETWDSDRGKAA